MTKLRETKLEQRKGGKKEEETFCTKIIGISIMFIIFSNTSAKAGLLGTVRIIPWIYIHRLWVFVVADLISITFLVCTSLCFIRCFFLSCKIKFANIPGSYYLFKISKLTYVDIRDPAYIGVTWHLVPSISKNLAHICECYSWITFLNILQERKQDELHFCHK